LAAGFQCTWVHRFQAGNQAADFLSKRAPDEQRDFTSVVSPATGALSPCDFATFLDFIDHDNA
jgi:hypothetical protein